MTPSPTPTEIAKHAPSVRMALEIEKVFDPHGDSPIGTDQFNAICDVCEKWLCRPAPETQPVAWMDAEGHVISAFDISHQSSEEPVVFSIPLYRSPV